MFSAATLSFYYKSILDHSHLNDIEPEKRYLKNCLISTVVSSFEFRDACVTEMGAF